MAQERSEAIVLRGVDFSETSRIVTFLTPQRGRMACIIKGLRRPKSALAPVIDTFNRLEILYYWKDGRSVQNLAEASLLDGFGPLKADLEKVTYAAFPLELAYRVAHENEPSEELYGVLAAGLSALNRWAHDVRTHTAWHALRLLAAAGFAPMLEACSECGAATRLSGFSYDAGARCERCPADRRLPGRTLDELRALAAAEGLCPAEKVDGEVFAVIHAYAVRQLESAFRSVRVLQQMFGT